MSRSLAALTREIAACRACPRPVAGLSSQPESVRRSDGLALSDADVLVRVRGVPPDSRPTPADFDGCQPYFARERAPLPNVRAVLGARGGGG